MTEERLAARRRRRRRRNVAWFIVLVLMGAVVLPRWTQGIVRGLMVTTVIGEAGPLEESVARRGLALWSEHVVSSPGDGVVRQLVLSGERAQRGQAVVVLQPGPADWRQAAQPAAAAGSARGGSDRNVYAPVAGLIRFDAVGPARPDPAEALQWSTEQLERVGSGRQALEPGSPVRRGDFLFRVVDNHRAFLFIPWDGAPPVQTGQRVRVRSERFGERAATVVAARPVPSGAPDDAVLLELDAWPFGWETLDWMDVEVVINTYDGTVVPEGVLVQRGERWGVYVQGRLGSLFHGVEVVGRAGGKAAVRGLAPGIPLVLDEARR